MYSRNAKQHLTTTSLKLLMHQRKQDNLLQIFKSLKVIHTLGKISQQIHKLLIDMDYTAAIQVS